MISTLRGTVLSALGTIVVIEVGGVGFSVNVTPAEALGARIGSELRLNTTLIVREDALTLFGFATPDELGVFELLIGVTGVGPKSALGVLSALSPDDIARAVAADDDAVFRKVSGIGPKTAKLITLSLAGKLVPTSPAAVPRIAAGVPAVDSVLAALVGLGWSERVAAQTLDEVVAETDESARASVPALLRLTLGRLGPSQHGRAS
ncbi:Holliday junction branch migration protein RuvA [Glaciibacter flavus]|uniref:Holliday junction branch migration complex subunit RuvA n=1 Tax=Orlajensenia flava TaxID=2565934 RepID=A0A4S4FWH4_9MICO|nr:Holliday junction branch migration protein RuvA [Glaciibacter flavus]THG35329.1 Holliday junction branch migration protein RuvA [Glaciibacter flavus]